MRVKTFVVVSLFAALFAACKEKQEPGKTTQQKTPVLRYTAIPEDRKSTRLNSSH